MIHKNNNNTKTSTSTTTTTTTNHTDAVGWSSPDEVDDYNDPPRKSPVEVDDDEEKQGLLLLPATAVDSVGFDVTTTSGTTGNCNTQEVGDASVLLTQHNYVSEMKKELWKILFVALPSVLTQICLNSLFPITASAVGRSLSSEQLAGYGLGALMGNFTCLSVIMGALSAADTLMPRAYAAKLYPQMGILVARSVVVCSVLLFFPMLLLSQPQWTTSLLITWGTEPEVAIYAADWMRLYIVGIPATMLFRTIQRFCFTQDHPWPPVQASILVTFVLHPLLLRRWVEPYGLTGSAWAIVASQYSMLTILIGIVLARKHCNQAFHVDSWPRFASLPFWVEVFQFGPLWGFFSLGLGGVVSMSEWWFWETVSFLAGNFGVVPFCAHSISYNLAQLTYTAPYGLGVGLTIRMGTILATTAPSSCSATEQQQHQQQHDSVRRATIVAITTLGVAGLVGLTEAAILYKCESIVIALFTSDPAVVETMESIWFTSCLYIFVLHMFAIHDAILRALGMQWRNAMVLTLVLWCLGLPVIAYLTLADKMEIGGLWDLLVLFYALIQLFMFASYIGADWARTGQPQKQPQQKRQLDFWTNAASSFLSGGGGSLLMTDEYQSAYEEAKGTIRHEVSSFGSPTSGTYTSVYYAQGGSERITFFSATQLIFEPILDLHSNVYGDDGKQGGKLDGVESMELTDSPQVRSPTFCWRITGHGNDSDGSFIVSEGFVVASGDAYWIEEEQSTPTSSGNNNSNKSTFPNFCYPVAKTTSPRMILNRGVFDFVDNSFTGSWISNIAGAVERPHHPEFRLQQSYNLAQQLAVRNVLVIHQHHQRDEESSQPMSEVTEAETRPGSKDDACVAGGRHANGHSLHSSILTSAPCPICTMPPTSGLYRCGYLEKGVFVWLTQRLSFEPHHQNSNEEANTIDKNSGTEQEAATYQIALSDTSYTPAGDKSGSSGVSFSYVHNDDLPQDGMLWKIKGNGTNSLGVTFTIVEGFVSTKTGKAYWVEQEEIAHQSQLQSKPTDNEESNSLKMPGRLVLSTGTFSFVMQDFVGWRQSSNDAPSCRYHEFGLLREEQHQGREDEQEEHQLSIAYQNAHEDAKSRVNDDVANLSLSPSLSGYYYNDSCTPTNGTYTFSYYNYFNEKNSNGECTDKQVLISTVRLHFESIDTRKHTTIDNNNNINNNCDDEEIGHSANSSRTWTITGVGKNASDGSVFIISEGLVSASGKAYWVQTSSPISESVASSKSPSFAISTGRTKPTQQRVVCTGDFVFAPLSHEVDFRGGWCNTSGQKRCFNQFSLTSSL